MIQKVIKLAHFYNPYCGQEKPIKRAELSLATSDQDYLVYYYRFITFILHLVRTKMKASESCLLSVQKKTKRDDSDPEATTMPMVDFSSH